jgi:hypothetical protein
MLLLKAAILWFVLRAFYVLYLLLEAAIYWFVLRVVSLFIFADRCSNMVVCAEG